MQNRSNNLIIRRTVFFFFYCVYQALNSSHRPLSSSLFFSSTYLIAKSVCLSTMALEKAFHTRLPSPHGVSKAPQ